MKSHIKKVVCAISGGVDSTVAALILKRKGYDVVGVFMKNWDSLYEDGQCNDFEDREDARKVCEKLKIPFKEVNFVKEYWNEIFSNFLEDYKRGYTPNPDIMCNKRIKFDSFLHLTLSQFEADVIATGHYARTSFGEDFENYNPEAGVHLFRGVDSKKDQSFFLSQVSQKALQKCIFPLGNLTKQQVREIACSENFHKIAKKKEVMLCDLNDDESSMGLCFVGRRNFQVFIEDYIEPQSGRFIDFDNGQVVGTHKGIHYWTVGQRCLIHGQREAFFVTDKDPKTQDIYVASGTNHPALFHQVVTTEKPHWIHSCPDELKHYGEFHCGFKFQHKDPVIQCKVKQLENGYLQIILPYPLRGITPGQFAVLYHDEECLGSARITPQGISAFVHHNSFVDSQDNIYC